MRFILGIFLAVTVFTATLSAAKVCADDVSGNSHQTIQNEKVQMNDNHSNDSSGNDHNCPTDCHHGTGHCHGPCFKHYTSGNISLRYQGGESHHHNSIFRAPKAPCLEGNRKPPKFS